MNRENPAVVYVDGMTDEQIRERLAPIKCFLLDMDGTFYLGDKLIEGSLDFLDALKRTGRTARFLTNNSSKSASVYAEKLKKMGVEERYRDVISSAHAAAHYCLKRFPGKKCYLLGNPMLREEMIAMGLELTEDDADYVLVAFDTTLDYAKMCKVCDYIREGKPYIAPARQLLHGASNRPDGPIHGPELGWSAVFPGWPEYLPGRCFGRLPDNLRKEQGRPDRPAECGRRRRSQRSPPGSFYFLR